MCIEVKYVGNQQITTTANPAVRIGDKWVIAEKPKAGSLFEALKDWFNGVGAYHSMDFIYKWSEFLGVSKQADWMQALSNYRNGCAVVHVVPAAKSFWDDVHKIEPCSTNRIARLAHGFSETIAMTGFSVCFFGGKTIGERFVNVTKWFNLGSDAADIAVQGTSLLEARRLAKKAKEMDAPQVICASLSAEQNYRILKLFKAMAATFGDFIQPFRLAVSAAGISFNVMAHFQQKLTSPHVASIKPDYRLV